MTDAMETEEQQQQAAAGDQGNATIEKRERRKKKSRWGAETEAGLKVLADKEEHPAPAEDKQEGEPAKKKRRSRWEPEESKPTVIPGLQIALPASLAHLVDINVDPKVMEIQRHLTNVSVNKMQQIRLRMTYRMQMRPSRMPISHRHASDA
jgi:hypothetical protein